MWPKTGFWARPWSLSRRLLTPFRWLLSQFSASKSTWSSQSHHNTRLIWLVYRLPGLWQTASVHRTKRWMIWWDLQPSHLQTAFGHPIRRSKMKWHSTAACKHTIRRSTSHPEAERARATIGSRRLCKRGFIRVGRILPAARRAGNLARRLIAASWAVKALEVALRLEWLPQSRERTIRLCRK